MLIAVGADSLVGAVSSDGRRDTNRKDYPSGAAPKVSHNRPVRMSSDQNEGDSGRSGPVVEACGRRNASRFRAGMVPRAMGLASGAA